VLHALWAEEKNTGDPATLKAIIAGCGLDADAVMKAGEAPETAAKRDEYTKAAIDNGVFGAPFFVIDGERVLGPGPARLRRAQAGLMIIGPRASKRGGYSARCALIAHVNALNHERAGCARSNDHTPGR
jgi:hypothetical protein